MNMSKNKLRYLIIWLLPLMALFACDTANNVEDPDLHYFVKYYGGDGNQRGVDMVTLSDGSLLLLGNWSESAFESDIYLVRVDPEGGVIWEKRLRQDITNAKDLELTNDGNFVVLSDFQVTIGGQTDVKLLKISPDGSPLDSVVFGSVANDYSRTVTALSDGGFIVSGTTELTETYFLVNNPDPDLGDFFNYRFDQSFNEFTENDWFPVSPGFGGKFDVAVKAIEKSGEYYVFGYSNINISNTNPNRRLGLFYFQRSLGGGETKPFYPGNILNVNDTEIHYVQPVAEALGSGFMIIGTSQNNIGVSEIFIARLRGSLTFQLPIQNDATLYNTIPLGRNIRGVSAGSSLTGAPGYLVLGNEVRSEGKLNFWLSKIDQSGTILWSTTFGSETEDDFGAAVTELPDGKIVVLGTMGLADKQSKMALVKVNPKGQLLK